MILLNFLPYNIIKYQLHIFQLEEYKVSDFIKSLFKKGLIPPNNLRQSLIWTNKIKFIFILSVFLQVFFSIIISYLVYFYWFDSLIIFILLIIIIFYLLNLLSFLFLIQTADLIKPFENYLKNKIINNARNKIKKFKDLKIIGITGSYGKTTMKDTIYRVLIEKYNVIKTSKNNNTPLGISRTILKEINETTEIFIVEMGEYYKGDIKELCNIAKPNISIITGINEAHLEKYGSMEDAISTKFEIIEFSVPDTYILLNADDKLIMDEYKKYINNKNVHFYSAKQIENQDNLEKFFLTSYKFDEESLRQNFSIENLGQFKTELLGEYIIGNFISAAILANHLGLSTNEIKLALTKIKPIEHRLEVKLNKNNIIFIDDTYNGNSNSIKEGIKLLNKFKKRRKVYITPGLVETSNMAKEIHLDIGKELANSADNIILIKNSVTPYIYQGLKANNFKEENIIWYKDSKTALKEFRNLLLPNDVVLMQNDWSDNYQ